MAATAATLKPAKLPNAPTGANMPLSIPFRPSSFRVLMMVGMAAAGLAGSGCVDDAVEDVIGGILGGLCQNTPPVGMVKIDSTSLTLRRGQVVPISGSARSSSGTQDLCHPALTWTSTNPGIVRIADSEPKYSTTAEGVAAGTAFIRASAAGISDSIRVTVIATSVASLVLDGPSSLLVGQTAQLSLIARDLSGNILRVGIVGWASTDTQLATISNQGMVIAMKDGTPILRATIEGQTVSLSMRISSDAPATKFSALSAGLHHTCGIVGGGGVVEGSLVCWGDGQSGQLGNNSLAISAIPQFVQTGGVLFKSIEAGTSHTCAISVAGEAYCWGKNQLQQLGDGTNVTSLTPTRVSTNVKFTSLVAGDGHTCGLTAEGVTYCWGGMPGQSVAVAVPAVVAGAPQFRQLSTERTLVCGLTEEGTVSCWGGSQLGLFVQPVSVSTAQRFVSIGSGDHHTCGVTQQGAVYCWGLNNSGQIDNARGSPVTPPALLPGGLNFKSIAPAGSFTCGITTAGARCLGATSMVVSGANGLNAPYPVPGETEHPFVSMTGGSFHGCAIDNRGGAWCFGLDTNGAIGAGNISSPGNAPLQIRIW
ncbi:MAG: hypothetical protein ABIS27_14895 [Longimicrobiales bacterium]